MQHTTDWTELNVLLCDGTHVLTGLLLCVWLRLTSSNKRILISSISGLPYVFSELQFFIVSVIVISFFSFSISGLLSLA